MSLLDAINNRISELEAATEARYKAAGYSVPTAAERKVAEMSGQNPYEYATQLDYIAAQQKEAEKAAKAAQKAAQKAATTSTSTSSKSSSSSSKSTSSKKSSASQTEENETEEIPSIKTLQDIRQESFQRKKARRQENGRKAAARKITEENIIEPITKAAEKTTSIIPSIKDKDEEAQTTQTASNAQYNPFPQGSMEENLFDIRNAEMADKKVQIDAQNNLNQMVTQYRQEAAAKGVDLDQELANMNAYTGDDKTIEELVQELDAERHPEKYPQEQEEAPKEIKVDKTNVNSYLDPNRYLEPVEEQAAQSYINEYKSTHSNYDKVASDIKKLNDSLYLGIWIDADKERNKIMQKYDIDLTEYHDIENVLALENKISDVSAFDKGFRETFNNILSLGDTAAEALNDITPDWLKIGADGGLSQEAKDARAIWENKEEKAATAAQTQSPVAYGGGRIADMAMRTAMGNGLLNGSGLVEAVAQQAGGSEFAKALATIGLDTAMVDIPTDTIPEMIENFNSGMSVEDVLKHAGINIASNVAMNGVMDALIPGIVKGAQKQAVEQAEKQAAEYAEALGKNVPFNLTDDAVEALVPGLKQSNNGSNIIPEINTANNLVGNTDDVVKQIPSDVTDNILLNDYKQRIANANTADDVEAIYKEAMDSGLDQTSTKELADIAQAKYIDVYDTTKAANVPSARQLTEEDLSSYFDNQLNPPTIKSLNDFNYNWDQYINGKYGSLNNFETNIPRITDVQPSTIRNGINLVDPTTGVKVSDTITEYADNMSKALDNWGTKHADLLNTTEIKASYDQLSQAIDDYTNAALHSDGNLDSLYRNIDDARNNLVRTARTIDEAAAKDKLLSQKFGSNASIMKNADQIRNTVNNIENIPKTSSIENTVASISDYADNTAKTIPDSARLEEARINAERIFGEEPTAIKSISDTPEVPNNTISSMAESTGTAPARASVDVPPETPKATTPSTANPKYGESRVVTNSAVNAKVIDAESLKNDPVIQDIAKYEKHSNAVTLEEAMNRVESEGQEWLNDFISGKKAISGDTDVDTSMLLMLDINKKIANATDPAEIASLTNQKNILLSKLREFGTKSGQDIQAFAKWNNTAEGAMLNAQKLEADRIINPWKSKNKKAVEGNNRVAKALAEMGNDTKASKTAKTLTHEQVKKGVITELEKEVGNVEKLFNDEDIEFLTKLAENKAIPVRQITDQIENRLKEGTWLTPTKTPSMNKLNSALSSFIEKEVRTTGETLAEPTFEQLKKEVKRTIENGAYDDMFHFTDNDIDYLANLIDNGATKETLTEALNAKLATGKFGISTETQQKITDLFQQANKYDVNSKQFVDYQMEAYKLLADEIDVKSTALDKFDTWRYLAMLGNPKTMLRNEVGNLTFNVVTGTSNTLAALGEAGVDKLVKGGKTVSNKLLGTDFDATKGIQRTKTILNPASATDRDLIGKSWADANNSSYRQLAGPKYEKMDKNTILQARSAFKNKPMQTAEKLVDIGISDYPFARTKYSSSLAGYLKANGYDASIFDTEAAYKQLKSLSETRLLTDAEKKSMEQLSKDVSNLKKAREYAIKQAEYATFHEDNAVAKFITQASNSARNSDNVFLKGAGTVIEGIVPFKKTPANVLRSGIEYSPLGALDSIKKTGKLIYENTGKRAGNLADTYINKAGKKVTKTLASDVIDSWSKSLTGTGLAGLGFYLYNKGILNVSEPALEYQDQLEGKQNYSLIINGKSYTIDWAAPSALPLFLGAEFAQLMPAIGEDDANFLDNIDKYMAVANRISDPIIETSMLSGVKDTIETAANAAQYNENLNIPTLILYNSLTGYAQQGIPTLFGQIARTVDPTRRSTYTDKEGVAGVLDKQTKKLMNKIPGLSTLNQPYVDTYGREQQNSPFDNTAANLAYQMFSPGYLSEINTTQADEISRQVYGYNQNEAMLPDWQSSIKIDGERVSPEKYYRGSKAAGKAQYEIREALANDEWFNSLDPAKQEDIMRQVNTISQHVGKAKADKEYTVENKAYEAYQEGGTEGLLNYYKGDEIVKNSGLSSSSKAVKEAKALAEAGKLDESQQVLDEKISMNEALESHGYDKNSETYQKIYTNYGGEKALDELETLGSVSAFYTYQDALTESGAAVPSIKDYANTYQKIDAYGDRNGSVSQKELKAYLNAGDYTEEEAIALAQLYGNWTKEPYITKNGTWSFH